MQIEEYYGGKIVELKEALVKELDGTDYERGELEAMQKTIENIGNFVISMALGLSENWCIDYLKRTGRWRIPSQQRLKEAENGNK